MSDMDSMTPPVSPSLSQQQKEAEKHTPTDDFEDSPDLFLQDIDLDFLETETGAADSEPHVFECAGEVFPCKGLNIYSRTTFHQKGIMRTGAIDRMFARSTNLSCPDPVVELFDFRFMYTCLKDDTDGIFLYARQAIQEVQNVPPFVPGPVSILQERNRKQLAQFLLYVNDYIDRGSLGEDIVKHKFLKTLSRNLHHLLVLSGRISEDFSLSSYSLDLLSSIHHKLHQRLELYWYLMMSFHTLSTAIGPADLPVEVRMCQVTPGEDFEGSALDQLIAVAITDLVSLAVPVFNRSFWIRLHLVLQKLWDETSTTSVTEDDVLETDVFVLNISHRPTNPLGFSLWLTTHLSHLFAFDACGNPCKPEPVHSCIVIVHMIMDKIVKTTPKEDMMRACLRCCLSISSLWPPNTQLITLLWEYFFRKLNDRFQLHVAGIEGLAVLSKTSTGLLDRCRKWCEGDATDLDKETSFHLFLQLLASLLRHGEAQSEWRSIKGRFYSKFHQRRMQELTETGLHNLASLFLTLGLCVDAEEVASKLMTFYDMLDPTTITSRLRAQVWCGGLAMTQLLVKQKKNFSDLAEKLASSFGSVSKQLSEPYLDYTQRQELSPLIILYIEGVRDILEHSDLEGAEHVLIGEGITNFLKSCSDSDLRQALSSLDSVIMRFRSVVSQWQEAQPFMTDSHAHLPQHKCVADQLWHHVYPFVLDHATTLTPPLCLADLAVSFTYLAVDFPAPYTVCSGGVIGVFQQFTADAVCSSIVCHYLSQVLSDPTLKDHIMSVSHPAPTVPNTMTTPPSKLARLEVKVQQSEIIRSWWRCVLLQPSSPSLSELTQQVMQLPEVKDLLKSRDSAASDREMLGAVQWKVFLKSISTAFRKAEGLLERQQVRNQVLPYFSGVAQQVAPILKIMSPLESMLSTYRGVGCLVKYCAPLLYVQSKPCPLPDVIKMMVLPASVFTTDKPLHTHFLAAVRETLHLFMEGLGSLDYSRDSFVQRQLRNIVTQYLPRFPLNQWDAYSHPVLRVLRPTTQSLPQEVVSFRQYVLNLALEQLRKSGNPTYADVAKQLSADFRR